MKKTDKDKENTNPFAKKKKGENPFAKNKKGENPFTKNKKGENPFAKKKKTKLKESVSGFISCIIKKDYSGAEKCLQSCVSEKIKDKILSTTR